MHAPVNAHAMAAWEVQVHPIKCHCFLLPAGEADSLWRRSAEVGRIKRLWRGQLVSSPSVQPCLIVLHQRCSCCFCDHNANEGKTGPRHTFAHHLHHSRGSSNGNKRLEAERGVSSFNLLGGWRSDLSWNCIFPNENHCPRAAINTGVQIQGCDQGLENGTKGRVTCLPAWEPQSELSL